MLSIFDLLTAKTLDLNLAAYLMARISRGVSFMVNNFIADSDYVSACRDFLEQMDPKIRTIEQTRRGVVEFLARNLSV
ncbi:MAG: hypothetical protein JW837_02765 [Sedimentisphaerales bacterium]|nr:hypothetical protein [Sedimentisphaerales bacterium]